MLDEPTSGLDPLMEVAFRDTVAEARAAGQAVFLSSHILSEVEALCDRVGILRALRGERVRLGVIALIAVLYTLANVIGYAQAYPTLASRQQLARAFSDNIALRLFYGVPHDLTTVGGCWSSPRRPSSASPGVTCRPADTGVPCGACRVVRAEF